MDPRNNRSFACGAQTQFIRIFIASKWAREMELLPENKVYNHTMELLERFMGKIYEIPQPIAMLRTRWYLNPHFNGVYSYRTVEAEKHHVHPRALAEPIDPENPVKYHINSILKLDEKLSVHSHCLIFSESFVCR